MPGEGKAGRVIQQERYTWDDVNKVTGLIYL